MFEKQQFYIRTQSGDVILAEIYEDHGTVAVLIGDRIRINLDSDSAFNLAEAILITANNLSRNERDGHGYRWTLEHDTGVGTRTTTGFTIDDLDSKTLAEATDNYEKVFVLIRETLEFNSSFCMDVPEERLRCCQAISDKLRESLLIRS